MLNILSFTFRIQPINNSLFYIFFLKTLDQPILRIKNLLSSDLRS